MSDQPKCNKCGGDRTPMKNKKGVWFVGCAKCHGKPADPPKPADPTKPAAPPKPAGKRTWADDWI